MSTFSLEKLVNAAFTSDLHQPFPVESYCEKFYNSKKTKNHSTEEDCLQGICLQIESYKKLLSVKIAQCTDLKHLLEATIEPFLVGLQRLIDVCFSLQRRVHLETAENDVQLKATSATTELTINKTGLCLIVKVLTEHSTILMKIIKNKLTSLFEESCSKKSNPKLTELVSKLAQYILVLELRLSSFHVDQTEKSSSFSFDAIFCHLLFDCLQDFTKKELARLLLTCSKEKIINWRLYLESLINLWRTALKPTLYVAFVQKLPNKPYKYCDPILPLSAEDVTLLLSQRDSIQKKAQTIFYSVALPEKKLSSLLKYIGESFVVIVQGRTKMNKSSSSKRFNTHQLFTLIRHYYNINSTFQSMSILFAEIDARFSQLLLEKTTTKDRNEKKHQQNKKAVHDHSTSTHLNKIQYLAIYERLLRCLLEDYLYNSPVCWEVIRTLMCRHVNDPQQPTQQQKTEGHSSFAKCLAGFMHYNLSSVHNSKPLDFTWLKNCIHLLGYLTNSRPTFERQYTSFLGKRLLSPNILYLNKERFVAYQLAIEYDLEMAVYAAHLEHMMRDVDVNSCEQYVHHYSVSGIAKKLHLKVNILTPLLWEEVVLPKKCLKDCLARVSPYLPKEVLSALNSFKDFYRKSGGGLKRRKLIQRFCIKHNWAVIELITSQSKTNDQSRKVITTDNTGSNDSDGPQILVTAAQVMLLQWLTDSESTSTNSTTFGRLQLGFKDIFSQSELNRALRLLLHFGVLKFKLTGNSKKLKRQQFEDESFSCSDDDQLVFCEPEEMIFADNSTYDFTSLKVGSSLEVLNSGISASKCNRSRASKETLTEAKIEQQYHLTIDAAIVHIAKKNGQLLYQELVDQVLAYLALKTCFQGVSCTASIIDRRMVKLLELELVTAEPAKLDTQIRNNVIKYCIIT